MTLRTKRYLDPVKVTKAIEATFGRGHGHVARFHEAMMAQGKHSHVLLYRCMSGETEPSVSLICDLGVVLSIKNPLTLLKG